MGTPDTQYSAANSSVSPSFEIGCSFQELNSFGQFLSLFDDVSCRKHSSVLTLILCLAYMVIFLFGVGGNILVIYVSTCKIARWTASCFFILNLAVADLLVILFCVPATLFANIFLPWILGEIMCKLVTYAQGGFVLISVYSLVAISFDRFRAVYSPFGVPRSLSQDEALKIICLIWAIGLLIPFPWAVVFQLVKVKVGASDQFHIPFCHEAWSSKNQEIIYFLLVNMFLSYILPLSIISVCNIHIWRNVYTSGYDRNQPLVRRIFYLKVFTVLTFLFFLLWLPLYLIMTRVKISYTNSYHGGPMEKSVMYVLIPIAQLLGSCNSCVNPILYAVLNQTFRQTVGKLFCVELCQRKTYSHGDIELNMRRDVNLCETYTRRSRNIMTETSL